MAAAKYGDVLYSKKPKITDDSRSAMTNGPMFRGRTRVLDSDINFVEAAQRYFYAEKFLTQTGRANFESLLTAPYSPYEKAAIAVSKQYIRIVENLFGERNRMQWCKEALKKARNKSVGDFRNGLEYCFWETIYVPSSHNSRLHFCFCGCWKEAYETRFLTLPKEVAHLRAKRGYSIKLMAADMPSAESITLDHI